MSAGGANSCNGSPRPSGPTTTRRRVADFIDAERSSNLSDFSDDGEDEINSTVTSHHHHHHHHIHHHHPVVKYLVLRRRMFFCVPETWLLWMEDVVFWIATMVHSLRFGRNLGRKAFAALMVLAVVLVFVKFSFLN
ncbi:hypothetical protein L1049_008413 [Liquidambar formosana]|uniref:Uncharacterized protein n=1 Tax=Liquidambar formosana TaxID=63359 RepID=A0AAP0X4K0_LIQFO